MLYLTHTEAMELIKGKSIENIEIDITEYKEEALTKLEAIFQCNRKDLFNTITNRNSLKTLIKQPYKDLLFLSSYIIFLFKDNISTLNNSSYSSPVLFGLTLQEITGQTRETKIQRLITPKFIHKKLIYLYNSFKDTQLIYKNKLLTPVSSFGSNLILERERKQAEYLKQIKLLNADSGQILCEQQITHKAKDFYITKIKKYITLYDLQEEAKQKRLYELFCVNKGLESKAKEEDKTFLFITLTLPACFKPSPKNNKVSYDNHTVKEGIKLLNKVFENFRKRKNDLLNNDNKRILKAFRKKELTSDVFGFWTKEPQQDGTPHTHFLMYVDKNDIHIIKRLFQYVVAQTFKKSGFKRSNATLDIKEDNGKASPSTYIFKYIMKTLSMDKAKIKDKNGQEKTIDIEEQETKSTEKNYKLHSYRRYGTFGIQNGLGIWRELKKLTLQKELLKEILNDLDKREDTFHPYKKFKITLKQKFLSILNSVRNNDFKKFIDLYDKDFLSLNYIESINEYNEIIKQPKNLIIFNKFYKSRNNYELFR